MYAAAGTGSGAVEADRMPFLVALFAGVAALSLLQGLGEFTLPVAMGETPFALTRGLAAAIGAPGLFAAILLHNLGLALLLPGCGLLAVRLERDAAKRRLVAPILLVALGGAIGLGFLTVLSTATAEARAFLLPLAAAEGTAILLVAVLTHREIRRFSTGDLTWRRVRLALHALRPALVGASVALAGLALAETLFLLGPA